MSKAERITLTDYEKLTGINNQTVSRAIKDGKISNKYYNKTGNRKPVYLEHEPASIEWLKNLHGTTQKTHQLRKKLEDYINTFHKKAASKKGKAKPKNTQAVEDNKKNGTYSDAQTKEKFYKANLAQLLYEEKKGELVEKKKVYSQLFEFGKQIRKELEMMPPRIKLEVVKCEGDVNKILEVFAKEIEKSLNNTINNLSDKEVG